MSERNPYQCIGCGTTEGDVTYPVCQSENCNICESCALDETRNYQCQCEPEADRIATLTAELDAARKRADRLRKTLNETQAAALSLDERLTTMLTEAIDLLESARPYQGDREITEAWRNRRHALLQKARAFLAAGKGEG